MKLMDNYASETGVPEDITEEEDTGNNKDSYVCTFVLRKSLIGSGD